MYLDRSLYPQATKSNFREEMDRYGTSANHAAMALAAREGQGTSPAAGSSPADAARPWQ
jgi:hypothetical protein